MFANLGSVIRGSSREAFWVAGFWRLADEDFDMANCLEELMGSGTFVTPSSEQSQA